MRLHYFLKKSTLLISFLTFIFFISCKEKAPKELPNILWLTSEDNSPFAGCYGDEFATTPNLDKLASEGFLYTHAYANAPVCAPARNTIITGVYACSNGNQHMRSYYPKSETVKTYPEFLREVGYYCTNNVKTDYNTTSINPDEIWDECSREAHYKNRAPGQPFFAVFNTTISHESSIHKWIPNEDLRHKPADVTLPPHHPDTPEMRHDWAQYYDKVEDMDTQIGKWLQELEDAGLTDNTIVFYYGDHGGVLARSKRYVYESGTRVPFIVRIPEKYKYLFPESNPGSKVDRLVSFVDLVPTLLSIAGIEIPDYLQGDAFLGEQKTEDPEYAFMFRGRMDERYDMSRAVRDKKFRYIRNYMPYRIYGQHLEYLWRAPSIGSWERAYKNGECDQVQSIFWEPKPAEELYDTENDPWEVNNLAEDPSYKDVLDRMRIANRDWMLRIEDTGFIPEADRIERAGEEPFYDYMRGGSVNLEKLIEVAEVATQGKPENMDLMISYLKDDESAVRYWGATGLLILGEKAASAKQDLEAALTDESPNVVVAAAETLYKLGEKEKSRSALLAVLEDGNPFARCYALNAIDGTEDSSQEMIDGVIAMIKRMPDMDRNRYDLRAARGLFEKWGLDPLKYDLVFNW
ncbi:sulfatase-like hydrolase/transferase [Maribellus comscasis]|uniref:Sulfatase-like hydrolase/transferase n=1 Tax=Maribellus comscasis TaxID=2681766 RepID=A0A6I6JL99_9BACT|nr:sulfatase-like hydrolase/transferase [Maribellus comscasis]QGY43625.1 sulfatase-like hydrolase/transferase [Maribellus comscasis]